METCNVEAIKKGVESKTTFMDDLREWSEICATSLPWDYAPICQLFNAFPDLHVLQPNLQLYRKYGVKGVMIQGNFSHGGGGVMAELEAYVQAKLLWNPDIDVKNVINEFLVGYFGQASVPISRYLDMMHEAVRPYHMSIYDMPDAPYFTEELLSRAEDLFDEAERLANDDEVLERIMNLRLQ